MKKAKEYYNEILPIIEMHQLDSSNENIDRVLEKINDILYSLIEEYQDLLMKRKIKRIDSMISCLKEINDKFHSICEMLYKKFDTEVLDRNSLVKTIEKAYKKDRELWKSINSLFSNLYVKK